MAPGFFFSPLIIYAFKKIHLEYYSDFARREKFLFKIFKALLEKRYMIFLLDKELIFVETEIFTKKII